MAHATKRLLAARGGLLDLRRLGVIALLALLLVLPLGVGGFLVYSLALCFANAIAVLSVSFLVRYGGEVSIGHSFFVALGAYAVAIMEKQFGVSLLLSLPVAVVLGLVGGVIFAFPSRRLSGIYLAVSTMALALAPRIRVNGIVLSGGNGADESLGSTQDPTTKVAESPDEIGRAVLAILALSSMTGQMIVPDGAPPPT